ncbi:MAG TPA: hypothetical protein VG826_04380 [Pirellulales bacterium]|nr:hypothetical protein [Pirellulales bacterium]
MRFESRTFWLSKDADEPAQYQDAFALDPETGRAAIADGVSSAIFSGPWARLLTLAAAADPPPLEDGAAFQAWLAEKRAAWANSVDTSKLTWYQRPKMVDGAMTTLLWLELVPAETNDQGLALRYQLQAFAIGDSCLFHVRDGKPLYWFPLETSGEFGLNPAVLASVDRQADHLLEFKARSQDCLPGDLLVLATDAIALWAIERIESGEMIDWARSWDCSDEDWRQEIFASREAKQMRFDDSTLVLLGVVEERPAPVRSPEETAEPELLPLSEETPPAEVEVVAQEEPYGEEQVEPASLEEASEPQSAELEEPARADEVDRLDAAIEEGMEKLDETAAANSEPEPTIGGENPTSRPTEG